MAFSVYIDYLKVAALYEGFLKDCENVSWKILDPDMFLAATPTFVYEHCTAPLDIIVSDLLGQDIRIRPTVGENYDVIIYYKWILSSIHNKMLDETNKEERDIMRSRGESKEDRKKEWNVIKQTYNKQEAKLIGFLIRYGQKEAPGIMPDEAISLYREFWNLSNWKEKNWDRRPDYAELRSLKPLVLDVKYHTEVYLKAENVEMKSVGMVQKDKKIPAFKVDFKMAGDQFVGGLKDRMDDIQRLIDAKNNDIRRIEEKLKKQKKAYEIQEMMEFIEFMDLIIANCARKYF